MPRGRIVLEMRAVTKRFHAGVRGCSASVTALDSFALSVRAGECIGVFGPPGSGKTTVALCAAGLARPDDGVIRWQGSARLTSRRGIAFTTDRDLLYGFLTVRETLENHLAVHDIEPEDRESSIRRALRMTQLASVESCRVSLLPPGMRRRVSLAQAVLGAPWLLILDALVDDLPAADMRIFREAIGGMLANGAAVLLTSGEQGALAGVAGKVVSLRAPGTTGIGPSTFEERPLIALVRESPDADRR